MASPYAYPPWLPQDEEADEFGNPIAPARLPFDPGPTPIPQAPPDPRAAGVNALPIEQATPPWAPPPAEEEAPPPALSPSGVPGQLTPTPETLGRPDPSRLPPWLAAPVSAANKQIDRGGMPPTTGISRVPSLAEQENKGITERGSLQAEKFDRGAQMMAGAVAEQERMMAEDQRKQQENQQRLAAINEQRMADTEAYANGNINPDRWRERNGFLGSLAYGLAAFFSGMANPRGPNQVTEWINREIERDLDAQRLDMQRKGNALTMKDNLYNDLVRQYGDVQLANSAFRANKLALAQAQIAAMEAGYAPEEEKQKTQQTLIETEKARRANEAEFQMRLYELDAKDRKAYLDAEEKRTDQLLRKYDTDVGAATTRRGQDISAATTRRGQDVSAKTEGAKVERELNQEDRKRAVFGPDPAGSGKNVVVGFIADPGQAEHVGRVISGYRQFQLHAKKYANLREKYGRTGGLSVAETAEMKSAYNSMAALWNKKMGLGAYDKGTETLIQGALPAPQSWRTASDYFGNTDSAMAQSLELGKQAMDEFMDSYGFQGADPTQRYSDYFPEGPAAGTGYVEPVDQGRKTTSPKAGQPLPAPRIGP